MREPEGNGCVERFIRTLKENLLWVRRFATIEELRLALLEFQHTYNKTVDLVERHGYHTPAAVSRRTAPAAPSRPPHEAASRCLTTVDRYSRSTAFSDPQLRKISRICMLLELR